MSRVCLVGDILVDISLKQNNSPLKMRLGGIIHAARCLWAMNIDYDLAYFAPSYLNKHIEEYLANFGCNKLIRLGSVDNCPYIMLIEEVKEVGNQGYEFILRDDISITYNDSEIEKLNSYSDIFAISGNYDFSKIYKKITEETNLYFDIANNIPDLSLFSSINKKIETIFISTSSDVFKNHIKKKAFDIDVFFNMFKHFSNKVVLKENRGGSRAFDFISNRKIEIPSQTQTIQHSVGVGDVYDIASVILSLNGYNFLESLSYSSWIAAEYAKTTFPEDFKKMVSRILKIPGKEIQEFKGCFIPWEKRTKIHIYLAAPDFDFVDTTHIDNLESSLLYHNFSPHRPIKENGQMPPNPTIAERQDLFIKDMELLDRCNILIAILLYNDPGTLIEIGIAAERKIPTLVYDPYGIANNCMLTQLPDIISSDLDEILTNVFIYTNNKTNETK